MKPVLQVYCNVLNLILSTVIRTILTRGFVLGLGLCMRVCLEYISQLNERSVRLSYFYAFVRRLSAGGVPFSGCP